MSDSYATVTVNYREVLPKKNPKKVLRSNQNFLARLKKQLSMPIYRKVLVDHVPGKVNQKTFDPPKMVPRAKKNGYRISSVPKADSLSATPVYYVYNI